MIEACIDVKLLLQSERVCSRDASIASIRSRRHLCAGRAKRCNRCTHCKHTMAPAAWLLLATGASALVAPVRRRATTPLQASTARDVLWTPDADYVKTTAMDRFQRAMGIDGTYEQLWDWSVSEPDQFWTQLQDFLDVEREGSDTPARTGDTMPDVQWFPSSKLNFAENLLRHGKGPLADAEAVITVSEGMGRKAWTFAELRRDAGRVQRALSKLGVDSSESCGAYIANVGEAVVAMLGATSTGATWTSCSPDFGARAVADRFGQVGPKVLFASDGACGGVPSYDAGARSRRWRAGATTTPS